MDRTAGAQAARLREHDIIVEKAEPKQADAASVDIDEGAEPSPPEATVAFAMDLEREPEEDVGGGVFGDEFSEGGGYR